jgi:hypothetical protein
MTGRYWLPTFAFLVYLLNVIPGIGAEQLPPASDKPPTTQIVVEHPAQLLDPESEKAAFDRTFWVQHSGDARTYQGICDNPKDRDYADLCQQWRTAEETLRSARWAAPLFWANVATILGLVATIVLSIFATLAATRAAKSAENSVVTAQDTAKQELRPYVFVDQYEFHWMNPPGRPNTLDHWRVTAVWKNSGQTPAHNIDTTIAAGFFENGKSPADIDFPDVLDLKVPAIDTDAGVCAPGQSVLSRLALPTDGLVRAWKGEGAVYYWGWIEYDGIAGMPRHRSEVCRQVILHGDPMKKDTKFTDLIKTAFNAMDDRCLRKPKTR